MAVNPWHCLPRFESCSRHSPFRNQLASIVKTGPLSSATMPSDERDATTSRAAARDRAERVSRLRGAPCASTASPALLAAARRLRRRLPGDERFGDPLSTAGPTPVEVVARGVSSLRPERESVVQEVGLAGLQLWQSLSEAAGRGRGEIELALLFTDLVGFSSWALQGRRRRDARAAARGRDRAVETAVLAHDRADRQAARRRRDGDVPRRAAAVDAALDAQDALPQVEVDGYRPRMRAGVHWGRPRKLGGDYLGVDVNIAARVADAAKADQVLVSDTALERLDQRQASASAGASDCGPTAPRATCMCVAVSRTASRQRAARSCDCTISCSGRRRHRSSAAVLPCGAFRLTGSTEESRVSTGFARRALTPCSVTEGHTIQRRSAPCLGRDCCCALSCAVLAASSRSRRTRGQRPASSSSRSAPGQSQISSLSGAVSAAAQPARPAELEHRLVSSIRSRAIQADLDAKRAELLEAAERADRRTRAAGAARGVRDPRRERALAAS